MIMLPAALAWAGRAPTQPSSTHRALRSKSTMLAGAPLDYEELRAMCGMWRANLDLEDEDEIGMRGDAGLGMPTEGGSGRSLMCHLDVRPLAVGHRTKLHTIDATVGTAQNLHWEASEVGAKVDERREPSVSSKIEVRLVLGPYVLEGVCQRRAQPRLADHA